MRTEPLYLLQIMLAGLGTAVAIASFLSSTLFLSFSSYVYLLLQNNTIYNSMPFGKMFLVEIAVVIFFIVIVSIDLKGENFSYIYIYNLILFAPEVLSYSQVNYLNLIDLSHLFSPNRSLQTAMVTGLIIVLSSCMIKFVAREREIMLNFHTRGVAREAVSKGERTSLRYTLIIGGSTFIVSLILLAVNDFFNFSRLSLFVMPYQQLVFGVASFILLLAGLLMFMNYIPASAHEKQ
jgi:hypothetical protein